MLFYLAAYGFSTIGAFAVVSLVRDSGGEATHLSQWAGLGKRHPLVAGIFALFLLAFAGIPLTSGFTAKFAVFAPAVAHGATWLAVIGVLASAIAAFFYVRVIVLMYFSEPSGDAHDGRHAQCDDDGGADHRRRGDGDPRRLPAAGPGPRGALRPCSCRDRHHRERCPRTTRPSRPRCGAAWTTSRSCSAARSARCTRPSATRPGT